MNGSNYSGTQWLVPFVGPGSLRAETIRYRVGYVHFKASDYESFIRSSKEG